MKTLIVQASSRKDGETFKVVTQLKEMTSWDTMDLLDYTISAYDYEHKNKTDDFLPLIKEIANKYDTVVLATPVYWYSMSGILKTFIDRFSDLLTIEKELGRKWRGKNMAVITCSNGNNLGESFWLPFQETAKYLGMHYKAHLHTIYNNIDTKELEYFVKLVNKKS